MQTTVDKHTDTVINHTMCCFHCGIKKTINVPSSRWTAYMSGESIDIAFSSFPKYTRTFFTKDVCKRCQAEGY